MSAYEFIQKTNDLTKNRGVQAQVAKFQGVQAQAPDLCGVLVFSVRAKKCATCHKHPWGGYLYPEQPCYAQLWILCRLFNEQF